MKSLNIISPWPSQRNGIADYAEQISQYIPIHHNVITEALNPVSKSENLRLLHPNDCDTHSALSTGINIFHFGNNPDHIYEVPLFLKYGGNIVLHDISLHYLTQLADGILPGFFDYFLRREHPAIADKLINIWRTTGKKTTIEYQEINLISWLMPAKNIIVHSEFAAQIVRGYLPQNKIHTISHFAYQFGLNINSILSAQNEFKKRYNIEENEIIISSVGFVTRNKQYDSIIKAINILPSDLRNRFRFIVAGESRRSEYDIYKSLEGTYAAEKTIVLEYLKEEALTELLAASDVVFNLRYPTFGESSGSIARALGCGCIIAVSNSGSYREISDNIVYKLPSKQDPSLEIAALLEEIVNTKENMIEKRVKVLQYASTQQHPERIVEQYMEVLGYEK